jgi:hypothetical protein
LGCVGKYKKISGSGIRCVEKILSKKFMLNSLKRFEHIPANGGHLELRVTYLFHEENKSQNPANQVCLK